MRHAAASADVHHSVIPRGWVILGLAVACWGLVAVTGVVLSTVFSYISAAVFA